jgi:hypothetical protein
MSQKNDKKLPEQRVSGMVKLRGGFSDRYGIVDYNKIQQIDEFDNETRIRLANRILMLFEGCFSDSFSRLFGHNSTKDEVVGRLCKNILTDLFCERINSYQYLLSWRELFTNKIEPVILCATYNEVLDTIQYCFRWLYKETHVDGFFRVMNETFEKEYIGYRFLEGYIVRITDEIELKEIADACNTVYDGARSHMKKAVRYLADRETKDYKNCIKESISAVESVCKVITGKDKAVLGDALVILEKNRALHPALKGGFNRLYDYTSGEGGIRHSEKLFESDVSFNEAKYFLVSCSAFVNYLIAEYAKGSN